MQAVTYHYVRRPDPAYPFFRFIDVDNFIQQLDFFEDQYGIMKVEEFQHVLRNPDAAVPNKIILTFDDGVIDHYQYVFPALKARGLWGIFYVASSPYTQKKMLDVHLIHLLVGAIEARVLNQQLAELIDDEMIPDKKIKAFRENTYPRNDSVGEMNQFKRMLNYYISYDHRSEVLAKLVRLNQVDADVSTYYMNEAMLKEMKNDGMLFGSHTVSHPVLSKLSTAAQQQEITESFDFLQGLLGPSPLKTFCYPYGRSHTFNEATVALLEQAGCDFSVCIEPRDITRDDLLKRRQVLPRYDCNQFPYGESP